MNESLIVGYMQKVGAAARAAAVTLASAATAAKNAALLAIAVRIEADATGILAANQRDLDAASTLDAALRDRLTLTPARIAAMALGLREVAALADPIGTVTDLAYRPSGIQVGRMRVPLGVVGIIYEARPNVTADAAALCLKSGNAAVLRGGSEAHHANQAIAACVRAGLTDVGCPPPRCR